MSLTSKLLYFAGFFLFLNSTYSSYQLSLPIKLAGFSSGSGLPLDLQIEAIIASLLVLTGALVDIQASKDRKLGPLSGLSKEAVKILASSPLKEIEMSEATNENEIEGFTGFDSLENRLNYTNWNAKRAQFTEWLKEQNQ
ncbi:DEKNAAC101379 [Brettanomyces naardenensis]|uniref:DEKNAAC101379 n=1 Tax=Brettanomyces naardenensis TaxID=13370 RepID=A0A448YHQ4_BRENA|nr:DEKNAAC101379 [Brettanomyces naardenensis]